MKKQLNVGFITTLSGRWPRELPEKRMKEYGEWMEENLPGIAAGLGLDPVEAALALKRLQNRISIC